MTNYQIPQNSLLKYKFFYQFLLGNERNVAQELRDQYVETVSRIYFSYFKSYTGRLMKIQVGIPEDLGILEGVGRAQEPFWGGILG
ncbi:vacuolar protein sorting-associated protein 52 homolog [Neopelma chrysocephalum]|uniref:vacuolar protein sorting-associated protein 52 homolog n=1 Tax=Neopelma chrysocephalum TaxID=114329 RepID=UPI000FCD421C|nr:vacuolar protein sorting-associated protein 52 homolog [Neopelma chrysocephalum]